MIITVDDVKKQLSEYSGYKLDIIVNENRSSMLSVLAHEGKWARVSLHRMFLEAPESVISAVATYVRDRCETSFAVIRAYIRDNFHRFDYSYRLDARTLCTQGRVYDLQVIYDAINDEYFDNSVDLRITWQEREMKKNCSRIVFGQYYEALKLIRVNKLIDDAAYPKYFVKYIVYHEMLHHVVPSYIDEKGIARVHSKEFKEREQLFKDYKRAKAWELKHRHQFFAELN